MVQGFRDHTISWDKYFHTSSCVKRWYSPHIGEGGMENLVSVLSLMGPVYCLPLLRTLYTDHLRRNLHGPYVQVLARSLPEDLGFWLLMEGVGPGAEQGIEGGVAPSIGFLQAPGALQSIRNTVGAGMAHWTAQGLGSQAGFADRFRV